MAKSGDIDILEYKTPLIINKFVGLRKRLISNLGCKDKYLATKYLAILTGNFIRFMERYAGLHSSRPCPFTRLPHEIFQDYSPEGPLAFVLETAHRWRIDRGWRKINLCKKEMYKKNCDMIRHISTKLKIEGYLPVRKIAFSSGIDPKEIPSLKELIVRHGAEWVENVEEATHIILEDQKIEDTGEDYLRTLEINKKECVAHVHWWYTPSSYDEWVKLGSIQSDPEPIRGHKGPWLVQKRFLYDCDKYNEWGLEKDYELLPEVDDQNISVEPALAAESASSEQTPSKSKKRLPPSDLEQSSSKRVRPNRISKKYWSRSVLHEDYFDEGIPSSTKSKKPRNKTRNATKSSKKKQGVEEEEIALTRMQIKRKREEVQIPVRVKFSQSKIPIVLPTYAQWFREDEIGKLEKVLVSRLDPMKSNEYLRVRNTIITMWRMNPRIYLSMTACRQVFSVDVTRLFLIHKFLTKWGLINFAVDEATIPHGRCQLLKPTHVHTPRSVLPYQNCQRSNAQYGQIPLFAKAAERARYPKCESVEKIIDDKKLTTIAEKSDKLNKSTVQKPLGLNENCLEYNIWEDRGGDIFDFVSEVANCLDPEFARFMIERADRYCNGQKKAGATKEDSKEVKFHHNVIKPGLFASMTPHPAGVDVIEEGVAMSGVIQEGGVAMSDVVQEEVALSGVVNARKEAVESIAAKELYGLPFRDFNVQFWCTDGNTRKKVNRPEEEVAVSGVVNIGKEGVESKVAEEEVAVSAVVNIGKEAVELKVAEEEVAVSGVVNIGKKGIESKAAEEEVAISGIVNIGKEGVESKAAEEEVAISGIVNIGKEDVESEAAEKEVAISDIGKEGVESKAAEEELALPGIVSTTKEGVESKAAKVDPKIGAKSTPSQITDSRELDIKKKCPPQGNFAANVSDIMPNSSVPTSIAEQAGFTVASGSNPHIKTHQQADPSHKVQSCRLQKSSISKTALKLEVQKKNLPVPTFASSRDLNDSNTKDTSQASSENRQDSGHCDNANAPNSATREKQSKRNKSPNPESQPTASICKLDQQNVRNPNSFSLRCSDDLVKESSSAVLRVSEPGHVSTAESANPGKGFNMHKGQRVLTKFGPGTVSEQPVPDSSLVKVKFIMGGYGTLCISDISPDSSANAPLFNEKSEGKVSKISLVESNRESQSAERNRKDELKYEQIPSGSRLRINKSLRPPAPEENSQHLSTESEIQKNLKSDPELIQLTTPIELTLKKVEARVVSESPLNEDYKVESKKQDRLSAGSVPVPSVPTEVSLLSLPANLVMVRKKVNFEKDPSYESCRNEETSPADTPQRKNTTVPPQVPRRVAKAELGDSSSQLNKSGKTDMEESKVPQPTSPILTNPISSSLIMTEPVIPMSQLEQKMKLISNNGPAQPKNLIPAGRKLVATTASKLNMPTGRSRGELLEAIVEALVKKNKELHRQNSILVGKLIRRRNQVEAIQTMSFKARIRVSEPKRVRELDREGLRPMKKRKKKKT